MLPPSSLAWPYELDILGQIHECSWLFLRVKEAEA